MLEKARGIVEVKEGAEAVREEEAMVVVSGHIGKYSNTSEHEYLQTMTWQRLWSFNDFFFHQVETVEAEMEMEEAMAEVRLDLRCTSWFQEQLKENQKISKCIPFLCDSGNGNGGNGGKWNLDWELLSAVLRNKKSPNTKKLGFPGNGGNGNGNGNGGDGDNGNGGNGGNGNDGGGDGGKFPAKLHDHVVR